MLPFIHRKSLSPSATTSLHKKTSSSQHERHLPEKLSSRNFSSSLKLKGPQHSQDGECDASSTSISQCDARDIGNFDQRQSKGQKIGIISQGAKLSRRSFIYLAKRFPQSFPHCQIKNRQQFYVTMESKKNKLETDEDKLDNHHDDTDCMVNKNWSKVLWRELKKQAKRIVNSEADADSSSDESLPDEKRKILHIGQKRSFDTCVTRRHSDSRNELDKHSLPNENLAFPSSEGVEVKIESWDRVTFHKMAPSVQTYMIIESNIVYNNPLTPAVSSHVSIPDQRNIQPVEVKRKSLKMSKSTHFEINNASAGESCPDSTNLQQMPKQMLPTVDSSVKSKTKGRKRLSSEGNTFIMVDPAEFERALGEEIPEDVLDRLRHGDEMVVHRFVDTRLERTEASERRDNRLIHSVYFPSDCRHFIYIPTENGSYWHQLDKCSANIISECGK